LPTSVCPVSGSGSSATYCQPSTTAGFVYKKFCGEQLIVSLPSLVEGCACQLLLQALFNKSSHGDISLPFSPSLMCSEHPSPSATCPFQFLLYCLLFSFSFCQTGVNPSSGLCWSMSGVAVRAQCAAYLLICWSASPKQIWNWPLAGMEALLVSHCNVAWRSFVWAGGSGYRIFASS
jgi:hypothetical protein